MLAAEKQALEADLKQRSIQIREKELAFFNTSMGSIATTCALLAGFSYANMQVHFEDNTIISQILKILYLTTTTLSMALNLLTVSNATFTIIFGTGLALRGPDGSMQRAVDGMAAERKVAVRAFFAGIISFQLSALTFALLRFRWPEATIVSLSLLAFIGGFLHFSRRIRGKFVIPKEKIVTGEVNLGGFRPEVNAANVCASCRAPLVPGHRFCQRCGVAAAEAVRAVPGPTKLARTCDACGATASPVARCCTSCGALLAAPGARLATPVPSAGAGGGGDSGSDSPRSIHSSAAVARARSASRASDS
eukprot:tig00000983_g5917.t1